MTLRLSFLISILLMLSIGCGKELGELCEDDSECESEVCAHVSSPAAKDTRQCSLACTDECPDGSTCASGYCVAACSESADCPEATACYPFFSGCFATCSSDDDCGNNTCSAMKLCNGE